MELFTEIYNCYFQIVDEICKTAATKEITENEMFALATRFGYEESGLTIVPKLTEKNWNLLSKTTNGYLSEIDNLEVLPLTTLQRRWIKALLLDERIGLFLDDPEKDTIAAYLEDVEPLFLPNDFYYYDRFCDGDDFTSQTYIAHFRSILTAIRKKQYIKIYFSSRRNNRICRTYLPCRIEYSAKNNKFRLLAIYEKKSGKKQIQIINLSRIEEISVTGDVCESPVDFEEAFKSSYYKEPIKLLITNKRNALERTMLHFANYEKRTRKLDDEHYECLIYYNQNDKTELLIEILSFGPTVKVLGPEHFVAQIKDRLKRQFTLLETERM